METHKNAPAKVYVDSSYKNGRATMGYVIVSHGGRFIDVHSERLPADIGGSNQAERLAVARVENKLAGEYEYFTIHTDSQETVYSYEPVTAGVSIRKIPREENVVADRIAEIAQLKW